MTPTQITTIDLKELKEVEIACDCGASLKFPIPLENKLIDEMTCLGCKRPMWIEGSEVHKRIADFLIALESWQSFPQTEKHSLNMRFVLRS